MSASQLLAQVERAPFLDRWSEWVVARSVDGFLALFVIGGVWLAARRVSPHFKSALLLLVFAPLVAPIPALLPTNAPTLSLHAALAQRLPVVEMAPVATSHVVAESTPSSPTAAVDSSAAWKSAVAAPPWRLLAFLSWSTIVASLLVHFVVNECRLRRTVGRARRLASAELPCNVDALARAAGVRPPVRVVVSAELVAPASVGLFRPTLILAPSHHTSLSRDELEFVLLHELAHFRRGDLWLGLVERLIRIAWFFHPAVWLVARPLAAERELACDDAALSRFPIHARRRCADAFLKVVELASTARPRIAGAAAMASALALVRSRIMRMVEPGRAVARGLTWSSSFALALIAAGLLFALQPTRGAAQEAPATPTEPPRKASAPFDAELAEHVALGADWLLRHQEPTGDWDPARFNVRCHDKACSGAGEPNNATGVTALAVLALLGASDVPHGSDFATAAQHGVAWLAQTQDGATGLIGGGTTGAHAIYNHAYATLALIESFTRSADAKLKPMIGRALDALLRARNPYLGWRYATTLPDGDNDTSVTGLVELVLAAAIDAGFPIDTGAIDGGFAWLDQMTDETSGRTGYQTRGCPPARTVDAMERFPADQSESLTAVALHARIAHDPKSVAAATVLRGVALLASKMPQWNERTGSIDLYYWFHGTRALRDVGGKSWERWQAATRRELVAHQRHAGEARGSFDAVDPWSKEGGRVYSTALGLLTLETLAAK